MSRLLPSLSALQIETLADAIERSRGRVLHLPGIVTEVGGSGQRAVLRELESLLSVSDRAGTVRLLRAVAAERGSATDAAEHRLELVWSGPERDGAGTRDTSVVVRELFQSASQEVVVAGYALYNAQPIFEPLAARMRRIPQLRARFFLNVSRESAASPDEAVFHFARVFRASHWPQGPLPEVYYDPRSLDGRAERRAVMHAKCVIVDSARTFITSANLTEAAQARNVELGVVINDPQWSRAVQRQFDDLIAQNFVQRVPLVQ